MSEGDKNGAHHPITFQILDKLAQVQSQLAGLAAQTAAILSEQARANDGRREVYARLEALALKGAEVDRIAPLVDKHEIAHQRNAGVGRFVNAAWMAVSGAVIAAGTLLANHYLNGPPAH
ncbi:hypothetical protein AB8Z38_04585 [Bradyrhizobium sp. LLZ17]|uniref:DUF1515 domain-containing protein n=1 Tax=Bradyrhizobium sp. LLZ17 TaxID=3239388 RepID=A0AB39XLF1_9BRAD